MEEFLKSRKAERALSYTRWQYAETKKHIGGFWVPEAADMEEALAWGRKAAVVRRASVEVRPFH